MMNHNIHENQKKERLSLCYASKGKAVDKIWLKNFGP